MFIVSLSNHVFSLLLSYLFKLPLLSFRWWNFIFKETQFGTARHLFFILGTNKRDISCWLLQCSTKFHCNSRQTQEPTTRFWSPTTRAIVSWFNIQQQRFVHATSTNRTGCQVRIVKRQKGWSSWREGKVGMAPRPFPFVFLLGLESGTRDQMSYWVV